MTPRLSIAALGLLCFALPAHADGDVQKLITPADKKRLDNYGETRKAALVIYGWFKCKVTDDGSGWRLEKISGSQRTKGRFFDDGEKRAIYLGSFYVNDDPAKPYGSGPQTDQVGYAFRNSAKEWRIEFPAPYYESKLDIIEFKR
ncbi:MAG: DUF4893 domain-containing protein [Mesorhizobium sp.]|uniref:DUF4893 domain-containing protein n=1 Tax=Mesorhizobium sp. TaxID=1871066 RepID=UPI001228684B|nr:DUF4893 domain-containing protein [Mesorhizobium sp.]TIN03514.1 MAG: DUF4893 domain-containing protein [Mesorhizobium sp.]